MTRMDIGSVRIDPVLDGVLVARPEDVLSRPGVTDPWLPHRGLLNASGDLEMPVGGFLVRTGQRIVLVDAGLGPVRGDGYTSGRLLDSLAALGVTTDAVTDVVLTHLHFDHVGWVTRRQEIVFPNAVYRCHQADWDHFVSAPGAEPGAIRKLSPLSDRLEPFTEDATIAPGLDVRAAPGHTPGSAIVIISSNHQRAMLLGDVVHCPMELTEPGWQTIYDVDPKLAQQTREALMRELEGSTIPAAAAHFPGMRFGRLLVGAGQSRWTFT